MCMIDWTSLAAWVQAIGSVAAILAAVWIGDRASRDAKALVESERKRQADIFASTFSMRLGFLAQEAEHKARIALDLGTSMPDNPLGKEALDNLFLLANIESLLAERKECLIFDRDSGIAVMTALDVVETYNPTTSTAITMHLFTGGKRSDFSALCADVRDRLLFVAEALRHAEEHLEQAHGFAEQSEP